MNFFFATIPRLALKISAHPIACFYNVLCLWICVLLDQLVGVKVAVKLYCSFKETRFTFIIMSKADVSVLKEVFLDEEYKWGVPTDVHTILDLGAHVGDTALYYYCVYPQAIIYAVEPNPILFDRLKEHVRGIERIVPVHGAVGDHSGEAVLHISQRSTLSSSLQERKSSDTSVSVPSFTISDLMQKLELSRVDLCKFDIEGGEASLFGDGGALLYANAYIGEFHGDLTGMALQDFLQYFEGFALDTQPIDRKERYLVKAFREQLVV